MKGQLCPTIKGCLTIVECPSKRPLHLYWLYCTCFLYFVQRFDLFLEKALYKCCLIIIIVLIIIRLIIERTWVEIALHTFWGNARLSAPVDYVLSVNNTIYSVWRMGCIRHGADNRIALFGCPIERCCLSERVIVLCLYVAHACSFNYKSDWNDHHCDCIVSSSCLK